MRDTTRTAESSIRRSKRRVFGKALTVTDGQHWKSRDAQAGKAEHSLMIALEIYISSVA